MSFFLNGFPFGLGSYFGAREDPQAGNRGPYQYQHPSDVGYSHNPFSTYGFEQQPQGPPQGPPQPRQQQQPAKPRPAASRHIVRTLPEIVVTKEDLDEDATNVECAICLRDQHLGDLCAKMPCGHLFCKGCLREWLSRSCSCPVCRYEVETSDAEYETERLRNMRGRRMRFRLRELQAKSVADLRSLMRALAIPTAGCLEKSDLIHRITISPGIELIKSASTAAATYTLAELMAMDVERLKRIAKSLGIRLTEEQEASHEPLDLIRLMAISGRIVVSTEGCTDEEIEALERTASKREKMRGQASTPGLYTSEQLKQMKMAELKSILGHFGVSDLQKAGLLERSDIVAEILKRQGN